MSDSEDDSGPELKGEVGKVDILGYPVHYEKFGTGPEILLLIPGAIGKSTNTNPKITMLNMNMFKELEGRIGCHN